jgi:hypothetical protein
MLKQCGWQPLSFDFAAELRDRNAAQQIRCSDKIGALQVDVLPPRMFASGQSFNLWRGLRGKASGGDGRQRQSADIFTFHPNFSGFAGGAKKALLQKLRYTSSSGSIASGWCL